MTEHNVYLIWSNEHGAWWGPQRSGYVRRVSDAGRYTHAEAVAICTASIPGTDMILGGVLPELPVRLADVEAMAEGHADAFPMIERPSWR